MESGKMLLLHSNEDGDDDDFDSDSALDQVESDLADTFERPDVRYAPLVYKTAVDRYGLHGSVIKLLREESVSLNPPWRKGEHTSSRPSFAHYFLNNCRSGMWVNVGPPPPHREGEEGI